MKKLLTVVFSLASVYSLTACNDKQQGGEVVEPKTEQPAEVVTEKTLFTYPTDLSEWYVKPSATVASRYSNYSADAELVILYNAGGPSFNKADGSAPNLVSISMNMTQKFAYYDFNQAQYFIKSQFEGNERKVTPEAAQEANDKSVEMMNKIVEKLSSEGKKVVLLGSSYGALLTNYYVSKYGTKNLAAVGSIVGRLDANPEHTDLLLASGGGTYPAICNGVASPTGAGDTLCVNFENYFFATENDFAKYGVVFSDKVNGLVNFQTVQAFGGLLQGTIFRNDFTAIYKSRKDVEFNKLVYLNGRKDEAIGALSEKEISFINDNGATLFYSQNEGHAAIAQIGDFFNKIQSIVK